MMEVKIFFFFILLQRIMYLAVFAADGESLSRSAYFSTLENKRLKGHVVKRFESPSLMSCSQSCLSNSWCTSTNFKMSSKKDDKGTCELNKHDISLINEDTKFHEQEGVTFSMLLKVSWWVPMTVMRIIDEIWRYCYCNSNVAVINSGLLYGCFALQFLNSWSEPQ